jgi:hypothetical protein
MNMRNFVKTGLVAALALSISSLSACAHKDLTAPCSRDSHWFSSFGGAYAATDCGPLLPVNR